MPRAISFLPLTSQPASELDESTLVRVFASDLDGLASFSPGTARTIDAIKAFVEQCVSQRVLIWRFASGSVCAISSMYEIGGWRRLGCAHLPLDATHEIGVYVVRAARGFGFGTRIAEFHMREIGVHKLVWRCGVTNFASAALARKLGFEPHALACRSCGVSSEMIFIF